MDATADPNAKPRKEYFLDTTKVLVPRENTEIVNFMKGGLIEDWDIFEELWDYINNRCLICDTKEHPLLMSESAVSIELKVKFFILYFSVEYS